MNIKKIKDLIVDETENRLNEIKERNRYNTKAEVEDKFYNTNVIYRIASITDAEIIKNTYFVKSIFSDKSDLTLFLTRNGGGTEYRFEFTETCEGVECNINNNTNTNSYKLIFGRSINSGNVAITLIGEEMENLPYLIYVAVHKIARIITTKREVTKRRHHIF